MRNFSNNPRILLAVTAAVTAVIIGFSIFPDKLPMLFKNEPAQPIPIAQTEISSLKKGIIIAASQHEDYLLFEADAQGLGKYLEEFGIFGKRFNEKVQTDTLPVTTTLIFLSDNKNQVAQYKDASGKHLFSYSLSFKKNILTVTVYLPPDVLSSSTASQTFGAGVIYALARTVQSSTKNPAINADTLVENVMGQKLFQITRKGQAPMQNSTSSATPNQ